MNEEDLKKIVDNAVSKSSKAKKSGKIVAICVAALLSAVAMFGVYLKLRKQGKELAKLKHEKNVAQEHAKQAEVNADLAENDKEFEQHVEEARQHIEVVTQLEDKISSLQQEHREQTDLIKSLSTWEDIEKYLDTRGAR